MQKSFDVLATWREQAAGEVAGQAARLRPLPAGGAAAGNARGTRAVLRGLTAPPLWRGRAVRDGSPGRTCYYGPGGQPGGAAATCGMGVGDVGLRAAGQPSDRAGAGPDRGCPGRHAARGAGRVVDAAQHRVHPDGRPGRRPRRHDAEPEVAGGRPGHHVQPRLLQRPVMLPVARDDPDRTVRRRTRASSATTTPVLRERRRPAHGGLVAAQRRLPHGADRQVHQRLPQSRPRPPTSRPAGTTGGAPARPASLGSRRCTTTTWT